MLQILEGVEAFSSYQAWAAANASHRLVKRFSCDDNSAKCRYEFTVLRALVLSDRATLRSDEERAAVLAQAAARAAVQAREERPLTEALQELGFSEHAAKMVATNWRLAHSVGLFRANKPTAEEI